MESLRVKKVRPSSNSKRNRCEFGIAHKMFRVVQKTDKNKARQLKPPFRKTTLMRHSRC